MGRFKIHYMKEHGGTLQKLPEMQEEEFLEWVRTEGVKVWYFDVFYYEEETL